MLVVVDEKVQETETCNLKYVFQAEFVLAGFY